MAITIGPTASKALQIPASFSVRVHVACVLVSNAIEASPASMGATDESSAGPAESSAGPGESLVGDESLPASAPVDAVPLAHATSTPASTAACAGDRAGIARASPSAASLTGRHDLVPDVRFPVSTF